MNSIVNNRIIELLVESKIINQDIKDLQSELDFFNYSDRTRMRREKRLRRKIEKLEDIKILLEHNEKLINK